MKKLRIIAIIILFVILSMKTAWAGEWGEWRYTSIGMKYMTSLHSVHNLSNVALPTEAFPNIISKGADYSSTYAEYASCYTVYGNSINNDTLTIGQTDRILNWSALPFEELKAVLHNHIKYIESIGGVMTGYAKHNADRWSGEFEHGYVISWDVGDRHHYAKFCISNSYIGYYDLEFSDGSDSEKYIPQLNDSLFLISWSQ